MSASFLWSSPRLLSSSYIPGVLKTYLKKQICITFIRHISHYLALKILPNSIWRSSRINRVERERSTTETIQFIKLKSVQHFNSTATLTTYLLVDCPKKVYRKCGGRQHINLAIHLNRHWCISSLPFDTRKKYKYLTLCGNHFN